MERLHAALGEDGRTDGSENGDDDLNDLFPSFLFHCNTDLILINKYFVL